MGCADRWALASRAWRVAETDVAETHVPTRVAETRRGLLERPAQHVDAGRGGGDGAEGHAEGAGLDEAAAGDQGAVAGADRAGAQALPQRESGRFVRVLTRCHAQSLRDHVAGGVEGL